MLLSNVLPEYDCADLLDRILNEVDLVICTHKGGESPRLIANAGIVLQSGDMILWSPFIDILWMKFPNFSR